MLLFVGLGNPTPDSESSPNKKIGGMMMTAPDMREASSMLN